MKITLDFDEELVARATTEASRRGLSLAKLVELALGSQVDPSSPIPRHRSHELPSLPKLRGGGPPRVDIANRNQVFLPE